MSGVIYCSCDEYSIRVTIYKEPEQGFKKLWEQSSVYESLVLNNWITTRDVFEKSTDVAIIYGMLREICIMFQDEVYFNGMKAVLDSEKYYKAFGQFGSIKVQCEKGRDRLERVELKDVISSITCRLSPGSQCLEVVGQQGTLPCIRNLVKTVVLMWSQDPQFRAAFKPNKNISF